LSSVTIYADGDWDGVFATAVLNYALTSRGAKVFIEFPPPQSRRGLVINNAYSVEITPYMGAELRNSVLIDHHDPRIRGGYVAKFDENGRRSITLQIIGAKSALDVALEYARTLNVYVDLPKEIIKDVAYIDMGKPSRLTRLGRAMYGAYRWFIHNQEFRTEMLNFAMSIITKRTVKLTPTIIEGAKNFEKALELRKEYISKAPYILANEVPIVVISKAYDNDFIKENYEYLKVVANEIAYDLERKHPLVVVIREEAGIHTMYVYTLNPQVSLASLLRKVSARIPSITYSVRRNVSIINFRNPAEAKLDNALKVANEIVAEYISK